MTEPPIGPTALMAAYDKALTTHKTLPEDGNVEILERIGVEAEPLHELALADAADTVTKALEKDPTRDPQLVGLLALQFYTGFLTGLYAGLDHKETDEQSG